MNKNTIVAFVLIFATVSFFMSPTYQRFYYTRILKQPYPADEDKRPQTVTDAKKETGSSADSGRKGEELKRAPPAAVVPVHDTGGAAAGIGDTVCVETKTMIAKIGQRGARIVSLKMKGYRIELQNKTDSAEKETEWVDLIAPKSAGCAGVSINNRGFDGKLFSLEKAAPKKTVLEKGDSATLSFVCTDSVTGGTVAKQFTFYADGYRIGLRILSGALANNRLTVFWPAGIQESENTAQGFSQIEMRAAHYSDGNSVAHIKAGRAAPKDFEDPPSGFQRWVGVTSKYFFIALVADTSRDADIKINAFEDKQPEAKEGKKNKSTRINYSFCFQYTPLAGSSQFWIYGGPSKYTYMKKQGLEFESMLFPVLSWARFIFWSDRWFPPLAEFLLWLLLVLYSVVKDYGIVILILTLLTRIVTYPLTRSSMKSMNRMKELQPKINALRQKHKNNSKKMNEEMMALYKQEGVNPLNPGCLPIFLQMPVFIALYVVLNRAIELRGTGTILLPWVHDLSRPESIFSLEKLIPGGIPMYGSNFAILPVIMAILTFFQNKMTIKDPNQKMMIYFMPVFMLVLFNNFPSGLVLYWTFSSLLQLLQQYYTDRKKAGQAAAPAAAAKR